MTRGGTHLGVGVIEFTHRSCVECEGKRTINDDTKILWSDHLGEWYSLLGYIRVSENAT